MDLAVGWFDEFLAQSGIQPHQACGVALLIFKSKFLLEAGHLSSKSSCALSAILTL